MNINRQDLQELSRIRQREAKVLLEAGCWHGARYLIGYAVECALKACIAKNTNRFDFPDKVFAAKAFSHNLEDLLTLAGLSDLFRRQVQASSDFAANWTTVKDWNESLRYERSCLETQARDLYDACVSRKSGILAWIRIQW